MVHPPVPVETFRWEPAEDYYLIVSELVPYKRIDIAVKLFQKSGRKLRVVGDGPEFAQLRNGAPANIEFCGRVSGEELRRLYARCRAFLLPGEEDFGITAVEAVASGKAVIALWVEEACRRSCLRKERSFMICRMRTRSKGRFGDSRLPKRRCLQPRSRPRLRASPRECLMRKWAGSCASGTYKSSRDVY